MSLLLAGDIGGTKTLSASGGRGRSGWSCSRRSVSSRPPGTIWRRWWPTSSPRRRPEKTPGCRLSRRGRPGAGGVGPAHQSSLAWRPSPWPAAGAAAARTGQRFRGAGLRPAPSGRLSDGDHARGGARASGPAADRGGWHGAGGGHGLPTPCGLQAMASEAAHGNFAPRCRCEWQLSNGCRQDLQLERVSIERVVSGTGLGHVARWLLERHRPGGDHPLSGGPALAGGRRGQRRGPICQPTRPAPPPPAMLWRPGGPGSVAGGLWQRLWGSGPDRPPPRGPLAGGRHRCQVAR